MQIASIISLRQGHVCSNYTNQPFQLHRACSNAREKRRPSDTPLLFIDYSALYSLFIQPRIYPLKRRFFPNRLHRPPGFPN
ncbi:hypothetical protein L1887_09682 [Cichorium endivia]|nr:hypothetical protein L1887_09682 [Cichorium endivia]